MSFNPLNVLFASIFPPRKLEFAAPKRLHLALGQIDQVTQLSINNSTGAWQPNCSSEYSILIKLLFEILHLRLDAPPFRHLCFTRNRSKTALTNIRKERIKLKYNIHLPTTAHHCETIWLDQQCLSCCLIDYQISSSHGRIMLYNENRKIYSFEGKKFTKMN